MMMIMMMMIIIIMMMIFLIAPFGKLHGQIILSKIVFVSTVIKSRILRDTWLLLRSGPEPRVGLLGNPHPVRVRDKV
jgi:hypothetical protein